MVSAADRRQDRIRPHGAQKVDAEHKMHQPYAAEGAGLHHRHGVQQGAHGCRGHHGRRQPTVQRHDGRLRSDSYQARNEDQPQHPQGSRAGQEPSRLEGRSRRQE